MTTTCSHCRFWRVDTLGDAGLCVRKAPSPSTATATRLPEAIWPLTWAENWCGEWEPKP